MAREKKTSTSAPEMKKERKVLEFNTVEQEEETPKKRRPFGLIIFLLVVILIAVGAGVYMNRTTYYNDYEVLSSAESSNTTQMDYLAYNGSLIKYSKEGISYLDKEGNSVWMESYNMKQPKAVVSGEYIAVADLNGNNVYIFNASGKVSMEETPYKICTVDVARQGVFAVILENETEDFIEIYDKNGGTIAEMRTTIADSGYPLDIALSEDGQKLMTSYITIQGIKAQNTIAAYNFGDVGQNETDRLVGGFNNLDSTIVPKLEFLNNDTVCAFGDDRFIVYSMKEKPSEKAVIKDFRGEIQSIFYNSRYIGVVEENAETAEEGQETADASRYRLRVFDTNGNQKFAKELNFSYKNIYATENEIIIVGDSESRIYDFTGKLKFSYEFAKNVNNIVPTGVNNKYIIVYDNSTEIVKLRYTKEEGQETK